MAADSRRAQIAGAAIEVLAAGGARALTHSAVDRRLSLPQGSTSFYFRTRRALVVAAAEKLITRSRQRFDQLTSDMPKELNLEYAAARIAAYMHELCAFRQDDLLARLALMPEVEENLRGLLARAFFSPEAAQALCRALGHRDPQRAASGLISLLEGAALRSTFEAPPKVTVMELHIMGILSRA